MERMESVDSPRPYTRLTHDWSSIINLCDTRRNPNPRSGYKRITKPVQSYCTGSSYAGSHDLLGFSGYGVYVYPHGVRYEGNFKDGQFDGEGTLTYPNGDKVKGAWVKGKRCKHTFQFSDGMEIHKEPWDYLKFPHRNFANEKGSVQQKFPLVEKMPVNFYYTGDGYFDPVSKVVYDFDKKSIRIASKNEETQIKKEFPHSTGDSAVGYLSNLFEFWVTGRKRETEEILEKLENEEDNSTTTSDVRHMDSCSVYSYILKIQKVY